MLDSSLTLHMRLTHGCNADCGYCSSGGFGIRQVMSVPEFKKSIQFVKSWIEKRALSPTIINIEYVGGEITLVRSDDLSAMVYYARQFFGQIGIKVVDGAQSNLLSSQEKVSHLHDLFEGRVGTSVDDYTGQRLLAGSSKKYNDTLHKNVRFIESKYKTKVPAVYVIDGESHQYAREQAVKWMSSGRNLTVRAAFSGKSKIKEVSNEDLVSAFIDVFDSWFLVSNVILEPFYSLIKKLDLPMSECDSYCNFQNNCSVKSLNIDPNGDVYVCQEMADTKRYPLGNAIKNETNELNWQSVHLRPRKLESDCFKCPHYKICQGGCMSETLSSGGDIYDKTPYCKSWMTIFDHIKSRFEENPKKSAEWLKKISN